MTKHDRFAEAAEKARTGGTGAQEPAPLGFKILIGAAAAYLVIRLVQIAAWLVDRLR